MLRPLLFSTNTAGSSQRNIKRDLGIVCFDGRSGFYHALSDNIECCTGVVGDDCDVSLTTLPFEVAIKTGSPQKTADISSSAVIGFAPADDPEIAFACYVEEGEYAKYMVRSIIDVYFGTGDGTPISADEIVTTAPTETTAPPEQTLSDTVTATETSAPETAAETTVPETSAAETSE